jgi:protein piccolo
MCILFFFSGNGIGMRVIGGKEIPGTGGQLGAYVTRIYPGGVVESLGEIKEGKKKKR